VQDPPVALVVEVRERPGHVDRDAEPLWPSQEAPLLVAATRSRRRGRPGTGRPHAGGSSRGGAPGCDGARWR
jgi:hypothetical protein